MMSRRSFLASAVGQSVPLVLRGPHPVGSWAPASLPDPDQDIMSRLADLYAGGTLGGGRIAGSWPGFEPRQLHQGRDLTPTTDLRALYKTVLVHRVGLDARTVDSSVFPDAGETDTVPDLIES